MSKIRFKRINIPQTDELSQQAWKGTKSHHYKWNENAIQTPISQLKPWCELIWPWNHHQWRLLNWVCCRGKPIHWRICKREIVRGSFVSWNHHACFSCSCDCKCLNPLSSFAGWKIRKKMKIFLGLCNWGRKLNYLILSVLI